jgi:GTP-dependent dephospho-CoA kinase
LSAEAPINEKIRQDLKVPVGQVFPDASLTRALLLPFFDSTGLTVSVGDRTTERLQEFGLSPSLEIVDSLEKRKQRKPPGFHEGENRQTLAASNPAGFITQDALKKIAQSLKFVSADAKVRLEIVGEEDLLALPVIVFFPKGTVTFYGQPNVGMVVVTSEESRRRSKAILETMGIDSLPEV